jgi:hypothetical protein
MNRKTLGGVLLVLGLVLIVGGLVVMFVIVPGMKQFPDDVDTTRMYSGTMPVLLNPATFEFMTDLNVDLERHFKTEEVDGDMALVLEEQTLSTQGQPLSQVIKRHVIDRKTMEFVENYSGDWAELEGYVQRGGLVLGWPIDTEKKDYDGWSDDYQDKVLLKYVDTVEHPRAKIETYYFTSESGPLPIDPIGVAALGLPTELTQAQIAGLLGGMEGVSPQIAAGLPIVMALAGWPDPVPLSYVYEYTGEYWIEPATGVLIDTHKVEIRKVGFSEELLGSLVEAISNLPGDAVDPAMLGELLPVTVFYLDYQATDESVQDAKKDALDAKDTIQLYGTTIPIALIVIGLVLGIAGAFVFMQKQAAA